MLSSFLILFFCFLFAIQAKDEFQRIMMKLTEEKQQYEGTIAEYKQVSTKRGLLQNYKHKLHS